MTSIYCDESGNSGEALTDFLQPYFVLASNDYSKAEAEELLRHVHSPQAKEAKFINLKKSSNGIRKLAKFLADPRLNETRVLVNIYHKRFMIITKMVDLIIENLLNDIGYDLYKDGQNIAMANMLYYCMPVFCGIENTDRLLSRFVDLMNKKIPIEVSAAAFYEAGAAMLNSCTNEEFKEDLRFITDPELFELWFPHIGNAPLEPAIPALFEHIAIWGKRKSDRFNVIHDDSKPILASQKDFMSMMAKGEEISRSIGYDRRKFLFPLRATSLEHGNSIQHPQIQISDICSGAINYYYKCLDRGELDDLAHLIKDTGCLRLVTNGIYPTPHVTPEDLGTSSDPGNNHIDFIVDFLKSNTQGD